MAAKPYVITDYSSPVENTRTQLIAEEKEKIKGAHGFIFNKFKTERQRIEEYLKNKEYERNISIINNLGLSLLKSDMKNDSSFLKKQKSQFLQPSMRFKPRTDLERIVDHYEKNSPGNIDKSILKRQLSKLELNKAKGDKIKKVKVYNDSLDPNLGEEEEEENPFFRKGSTGKDKKQTISILNSANKGFFIDKDLDKELYNDKLKDIYNNSPKLIIANDKSINKYLKRKQVDNSRAKEILKELYQKTHFKGAIDLASHSNYP